MANVGRSGLLTKTGTCNSNGNNTLIAAVTDYAICIFGFSITTSSTTNFTATFRSGAAGTDLWGLELQAPTGVTTGANLAVAPPGWLFRTDTSALFNLNLTSAQTVRYSLAYFLL